MFTPQDIKEKGFARAVIGGYEMDAVDEFLEQLEADYGSLFRENEVLRRELNMLAKKVEEYQENEASILRSAHQESERLIKEAAEKGREKTKDEEEQAKRTLAELNSKIAAEKRRLAGLCADTDQYIAAIHRLMERQEEYLQSLRSATVDVRKKNGLAKSAKPSKKPEKQPAPPVIMPEIDLDDSEDSATAEEINDFVAKIMNDMKPVAEQEPTVTSNKKAGKSAAKSGKSDEKFDFKSMKFNN